MNELTEAGPTVGRKPAPPGWERETTRARPAPPAALGLAEWLSLGALAFGALHTLIDFGAGLFPLQGAVSPAVGAVLGLTSLVLVWWAISLAAAARGVGGGLASLAVLGLGWTLLANGYPIVFCPPPCPAAAPLGDVSHLGSLAFGLVAPGAALWALRRRRLKVGWRLPASAAALAVATLVALANAVTPR